MLSIDEAIAHAREVAEEQKELFRLCPYPSQECNGADICKCLKNKHDGCIKCAEEHEQLAEWLEELKDYRDKNKMVVRIDVENMDSIKDKIEEYAESKYNKAIDECNKKLDELERNYKSCSGTEIIEMYAHVYEDFRAWLKEQNK